MHGSTFDAGSDLVIQVHLRKTGRVEQIQPSVALFFTDAEDAVGYGMLLIADPQNERLRNGKAAVHYNLGTLLLGSRRWSDAAAQFTAALELRPEHGNTYNNLGVALLAQGQVHAAVDRFRRALALDSSNDAARQNLADALARMKNEIA